MTEIKFDAANWFDYNCYKRYLNTKPLKRSLAALEGVSVYDVSYYSDATIKAFIEIDINTNEIVKINNKDVDVIIRINSSYHPNYEIETNLSSEDAAKAERNLKSAIKAGRTVFKVPTTARIKKNPSIFRDWARMYARNDEEVIDEEKSYELLGAVMRGEVTDLGEYEFLRDLVPTPKDERIEFICEVPEELRLSSNSSKQKFHIEDWLNYYNAKLDEDDLKDSFSEEDLSGATSIQFDGEIISADLESNVSDLISVMAVDDETDEEEEYEVEIFADFTYSVDYKIDDLEEYIEDFTRSLNDAIDKEESTFEIRVPFVAGKAYDLEVNVTEIYDDEVDEGKVRQAAFEHISDSLDEPTFQMHHGDSIQPPQDKEVTFICTIPAE